MVQWYWVQCYDSKYMLCKSKLTEKSVAKNFLWNYKFLLYVLTAQQLGWAVFYVVSR